MKVLLLAGLGPTYKNSTYLSGSLLDRDHGSRYAREYLRETSLDGFELNELGFEHAGARYPLLRPRRASVPHLTTFTLTAILRQAGADFVHVSTDRVFGGEDREPVPHADVVLVSTSYIWNEQLLRRAVDWAHSRLPGAYLVLGGQYTNLKYARVMERYAAVDAIVRGDGERALPLLLKALEGKGRLEDVPNLVWRDPRSLLGATVNAFEYLDLDAAPSPMLTGEHPVVPYESMRGCPFTCKFCSFPAASPKWRYKSARKIADDWARYAADNGSLFIKAMDSTFTVPPTRMRELMKILPSVQVEWEGYSRANVIKDEGFLEGLANAHCRFLSLGFESMSDTTLELMDKKVSRKQNLRAFSLLRASDVGYRCSFMTGYPGETPEDFALTRDFLVHEYEGHFMLSVFSVSDETMPVWQDRERLQIEVHDPEEPDYSWSHIGMDVHTARTLNHDTLDTVRRSNSNAVLMLWQADYQHWLLPHATTAANLAVEKAVERIGLAPRDVQAGRDAASYIADQLDILRTHGVTRGDSSSYCTKPLLEVVH